MRLFDQQVATRHIAPKLSEMRPTLLLATNIIGSHISIGAKLDDLG